MGKTKLSDSSLIYFIARKARISYAQAEATLAQFKLAIFNALKNDEPVELVGFGKFEVRVRSATTMFIPATGRLIQVSAKKYPVFTSGKKLKAAICIDTPSDGK